MPQGLLSCLPPRQQPTGPRLRGGWGGCWFGAGAYEQGSVAHEDEVGTRAEVKSDVKEKTKESRAGKEREKERSVVRDLSVKHHLRGSERRSKSKKEQKAEVELCVRVILQSFRRISAFFSSDLRLFALVVFLSV